MARVMVGMVGDALNENVAMKSDLSSLATKADLSELQAATRAEIAELRAVTQSDIAEMASKRDLEAGLSNLRYEFKADLKDLESRLTLRMMGISLSIVVLTSAVIGVLNQIQG